MSSLQLINAWLIDENKTVTYTEVANKLSIHVNQAKKYVISPRIPPIHPSSKSETCMSDMSPLSDNFWSNCDTIRISIMVGHGMMLIMWCNVRNQMCFTCQLHSNVHLTNS